MTGKAKMVQRSRFNFLGEAQIWYNRNLEQRPLSDEFENVIVLSDEFYREITSHPIPTDLEAGWKFLPTRPAQVVAHFAATGMRTLAKLLRYSVRRSLLAVVATV